MIGNKIQPYKYSMKIGTLADFELSGSSLVGFYLVPPKDAITLENMIMHFKIQFDASSAAGDRKINRIVVTDNSWSVRTDGSEFRADYFRPLTVDLTTDGNRIIDFKMDVTSLINKNNADYAEQYGADPVDINWVFVEMPTGINDLATAGVIKLWKVEGLYTTKGIR